MYYVLHSIRIYTVPYKILIDSEIKLAVYKRLQVGSTLSQYHWYVISSKSV